MLLSPSPLTIQSALLEAGKTTMSYSSEDEDSNVNIIPMENFPSDGDMSTWPSSHYIERSDLRWRQLLAENWLKDMGTYEDGELIADASDSRFVWHTGFVALYFFPHCICWVTASVVSCSFVHSLLRALCWPVMASLFCLYTLYLYSQTNRAYIRCHSYH